jgi:hypothetical protein
MKIALGFFSLLILGSSSTNLAKNFFESVKSNAYVEGFLSGYKKESKNNNVMGQAGHQDTDLSGKEKAKDMNPFAEVPEYVVYDRMFILIEIFRKMAEEQASRGEEVTAFHGYFEREANLNDWQAKILRETSVEYAHAVEVVDSQAEIVIEELRKEYPAGSMPEGDLIKPSPELLRLQDQRNILALQYRDQLSDLLGHDKFEELNQFVRGRFASGFQVVPVSLGSDAKQQGGQ